MQELQYAPQNCFHFSFEYIAAFLEIFLPCARLKNEDKMPKTEVTLTATWGLLCKQDSHVKMQSFVVLERMSKA